MLKYSLSKTMLVAAFTLLLTLGCDVQTAQPEVHLIPQGFVGHVTLYFDVPNGSPKKRDGNALLYEIPASGKLRLNVPPNQGIRPANSTLFYYVNSQGVRTLIPSHTNKNLSSNTVVVSNLYVMNKELHYFIDRLDRIDKYKNPAIVDSERQ
jgi:hypothetical protein